MASVFADVMESAIAPAMASSAPEASALPAPSFSQDIPSTSNATPSSSSQSVPSLENLAMQQMHPFPLDLTTPPNQAPSNVPPILADHENLGSTVPIAPAPGDIKPIELGPFNTPPPGYQSTPSGTTTGPSTTQFPVSNGGLHSIRNYFNDVAAQNSSGLGLQNNNTSPGYGKQNDSKSSLLTNMLLGPRLTVSPSINFGDHARPQPQTVSTGTIR